MNYKPYPCHPQTGRSAQQCHEVYSTCATRPNWVILGSNQNPLPLNSITFDWLTFGLKLLALCMWKWDSVHLLLLSHYIFSSSAMHVSCTGPSPPLAASNTAVPLLVFSFTPLHPVWCPRHRGRVPYWKSTVVFNDSHALIPTKGWYFIIPKPFLSPNSEGKVSGGSEAQQKCHVAFLTE